MADLYERVEAPQPAVPRRGLVAAALLPTDPDPAGWIDGYSYLPYTCDPAVAIPIFCAPVMVTGPDLVTDGGFADVDLSPWGEPDGWAVAAGVAEHTPGDVEPLIQSFPVRRGDTYEVTLTIAGRTAGSVTVSLGGDLEGGITATPGAPVALTPIGDGTQPFRITPTTDFDGSVDAVVVVRHDAAYKPHPSNPERVDFRPFLVVGADRCGTGRPDQEARARAHLAATEGYAIEREFWSGAIAAAEGYPNAYLEDGDTTVLDDAARVDAFASLEQALSDCLHGARGMIHVTVAEAVRLAAANLITADGTTLVSTATGTIVVAGAGYPGTGPGGEDPAAGTFMYGTGMVTVRRGPVTVVDAGDRTSRIDRGINRETLYVERPVGFATAGCCRIAVNAT